RALIQGKDVRHVTLRFRLRLHGGVGARRDRFGRSAHFHRFLAVTARAHRDGRYNRSMVRWLVFSSAICLVGCAGSSIAPRVPVDQRIRRAPGQSLTVGDSIAIRFIGVQGDSRCPADAMCIQGGDAVVKLHVTHDREAHDVDLHTGNMKPATAGNVTVTLVELTPYPFSSRTISPDEYRATLRVTR